MVVTWTLAASGLFLFLMVIVLAVQNPRKILKKSQIEQNQAVAHLQLYLQRTLRPQHEIRLKPDGGDLSVYVSKTDFESVPIPHRKEFMTAAGKAWCQKNTQGVLPSLSIYDYGTGGWFGTYSCTFSRVSLP